MPLFLHMLRSEAGDDDARIAAVLRGVRAYQQAPRPPARPRPPAIARAGCAALLDFGTAGRPIVFVPSLINSSAILDLDTGRSLLRWLGAQGLRPMLVDWGSPDPGDRDRDIGGYVLDLLLPLLATLEQPPILVGYCLGGTMAIGAAALTRVAGLALLATPWRFGCYPEDTRRLMHDLWRDARPAAEQIGLVPIEVLQTAFWRIDAARTFDKFAEIGRSAGDAAAMRAFVAVEDWANDGAPLTYGAGCDLFETMLHQDRPGNGAWQVGGVAIDPAALDLPMLEIVSTSDRIVPAAVAIGRGDRIETGLGHVGMIISRRAPAEIWTPLAQWLRAIG